jgi:hypothetical protein
MSAFHAMHILRRELSLHWLLLKNQVGERRERVIPHGFEVKVLTYESSFSEMVGFSGVHLHPHACSPTPRLHCSLGFLRQLPL